MHMHPTIYKTDSKGKTRVWYIEQDGHKYRSYDGTINGKIKCSEWTEAEATNEGRANYRDPAAQASFEIEALYKKKLDKDYHTKLTDNMATKITQPMLAASSATVATANLPAFVQPKLDGIRCVVTKTGMWSRSGKPIISCPHIFDMLKAQFDLADNDIEFFDGELYNHDYRDDFNEILSMVNTRTAGSLTDEVLKRNAQVVQYHLYDVKCADSTIPFAKRFQRLTSLVEQYDPAQTVLRIVETQWIRSQELLQFFYQSAMEQGYEGIMVRADKPYEHKRSKSLIKIKDFTDQEYRVLSLEEGNGNWSGTIKSVLCRDKQGRTFSAGVKGNRSFTDSLWARRDNPPKEVTVRYQNLTPDGIPRFPIAVAFYDDVRDT